MFFSSSSILPVPMSKKGVQVPHWYVAIGNEYAALMKNQTWTLVNLPQLAKVIGNLWVFKAKEKSDDTLDKYKAWLVVQGFCKPLCLISMRRLVQ